MFQRLQAIRKRGFNLIEAAIVLGVVGAVIGGIWSAASSVIESHKVNKTVEGVLFTFRNAQKLFSIQDANSLPDATNITSTLRDAGALPTDWVQNGQLKNPYGGLSYASIRNNVNQQRIDFMLYKIPSKACIKVLTKITGIARTTSTTNFYTGISLNWVSIQTEDLVTQAAWNASSFPLSIENVSNACNTGSVVGLAFSVGLTRNNN